MNGGDKNAIENTIAERNRVYHTENMTQFN